MEYNNNKTSIRPMTVDDTPNVIRWRNAPFVMNNFLYREPLDEATHLNWIKEKIETGKVAQFIIYSKELGKDVGSVFLRDIDQETKEAEYGIFIGEEDALGHGIGKEACETMVKYAKDALELKRVFLRVFEDNLPAIRSYEAAGFLRIPGSDVTHYSRNMIFMEIRF